VKLLPVPVPASEMTYTVSGGALLNPNPYPQGIPAQP